MSLRAVANEFAKMRRLRVGLLVLVMVLAVLGTSLMGMASVVDLDPDAVSAWHALLAGASLGTALVCPLLIAVLASRQTDVEHQGNGWLMQTAAGLTPGGVCRAKFIALSLVLTLTTLVTSVLVLGIGRLLGGFLAPVPAGQWIGFTLCTAVIGLVVLALHLLISAKVENQLVALGVGVLGTLLAVFSRGLPDVVAYLTPWGYYALARGAGYRGEGMAAMPIPYGSVAALAFLALVIFTVLTSRFDRQEA